MRTSLDPPERRFARGLWRQLKKPWVLKGTLWLAKLVIQIFFDP